MLAALRDVFVGLVGPKRPRTQPRPEELVQAEIMMVLVQQRPGWDFLSSVDATAIQVQGVAISIGELVPRLGGVPYLRRQYVIMEFVEQTLAAARTGSAIASAYLGR